MRPDPSPRRTRDLVPERGRRLHSSGLVPHHRGLWAPRTADRNHPLTRITAITALYPGAIATGWLAADAHGHPFPPRDYPDEFAAGSTRVRRPGMIGRQYTIPREHVCHLSGTAGAGLAASPAWALFDIARRGDLTDAVCALDAGPSIGVDPERDVRPLAMNPRRIPGKRQVLAALDLCDIGAQSPWETRTRLFLMNHGLTGFETQVPVPGLPYHLDLGRRDLKVGVEYDGEYHRDPAQHAKDLTRWNRLRLAGWLVYPLTTTMVTRDAQATAADIRAGVRERGG
ncbi:endonuclease domain-containing protein [Dietzia natronolimnaea]|uniref:endonuclease domain-containing protein n=1 Tax=Dietzia natronolimnaea TaxID=161920 RepID=UPI0015FDE206|nr:DUF559 domain-containing protein [Dietzia natronolimnaea]MBB1038750.1 DUF559 domain-containing protein [Dietzia natronolimnaea]